MSASEPSPAPEQRPNLPARADQLLFALFIVILPLMKPFGSWLGGYVYVADTLFLCAAGAWLLALMRRRASFRRSWWYLPLALYFTVMLASALGSEDRGRSLAKLAIEAYVLALAVLSFNQSRSLPDLRRISRAWMIAAALTSAAALLGVALFYAGVRDPAVNIALGGYGSLPAGNYPRVTGLFLNFNMACNYLSVSLLLALAMRRLGWLGATAFRVLALLTGLAAAFTISPGLGGLLLAAGIWLFLRWRETRRALARSALALASAAAIAFLLAASVSPVSGGQGQTLLTVADRRIAPSSRLLCWTAAIAVVRDYPLLGQGVGTDVPCPPYLDAQGREQHLLDAHQTFLNVAAQKGFTGLAALAAIIVYLVVRMRPLRIIGSASDLLRTALGISFLQAFLYQGLTGSLEHTRHLWVLMGLLAGVSEVSPQTSIGRDAQA